MSKSVISILVGRKKVEWIAYNHRISEHAKMQMVRRRYPAEYNMTGAILNSPLAWKLEDEYIAIAINLYEYVVVANAPNAGEATVVTYINLSDDDYSVIDKMLVTYQDAIRAKGVEK